MLEKSYFADVSSCSRSPVACAPAPGARLAHGPGGASAWQSIEDGMGREGIARRLTPAQRNDDDMINDDDAPITTPAPKSSTAPAHDLESLIHTFNVSALPAAHQDAPPTDEEIARVVQHIVSTTAESSKVATVASSRIHSSPSRPRSASSRASVMMWK